MTDRRPKLRQMLPRSLTAAALALLALAPAAASAEPAIDEYSIRVPGVGAAGVPSSTRAGNQAHAGEPALQIGVAGESSATESPLRALASSLRESPLIPLGLLVGLALLLLAAHRRSRSTA